jgi:phosphoglycerate dehydrogenase-like enzyme
VVGAGGIGSEVGRLCAALGMRVVGTRRQPRPGAPLPHGFREIGGAEALDRLLPDSDFVVICCQWTPETMRLFDQARFAAMKKGSVLVNVARGEIVDEDALLDALQRDHLRGAALDVYVGEFERPPMAQLWSDRRVLITPHVSNGSDENRHVLGRRPSDSGRAGELAQARALAEAALGDYAADWRELSAVDHMGHG